MSKSLSVLILLPMNDYNSADVYCEDEKLKREHVDEGVYCLPYKCLAVDIYGSVISKLLSDTFTIIDDELIDRAIKLIGCQYSSDLDFEEADSKHGFWGDNAFDVELDYEGDMDGKLLVSLIVGKYMAERVKGIAVAEYD